MNDLKIVYPALYNSSNRASVKAQKRYINISIFNLLSLILASSLSAISFDSNILTIISAILLFFSLILTVLMFYIKFEKKWYEGRAIAESIKTLTWKFMMGAQPFDIEFEINEAETRLIKNFKKIIGQKKDFFELIGGDFGTEDQITDRMRVVRKMTMEEKKNLYLKERVDDQQNWYANRSAENKKYKNITFWIIIVFILLSGVGLVLNLQNSNLKIIITPVTVTLASSLIAWMQLKRYQELTQSYSITANELGVIRSKAHHISNEIELSDFVDDAESAISREHTLWLARRDNIELFN